ncbi:hypothetical protein BABINDRAFT_159304 [Babjeviella inositovora NRRL Y-12698]|uniref:Protein CMS1 n=1 Tax=Babjeviella inositovora NRRL Y-12698 TaxID=984486 RepID=A0A1E3R0B4_9ASCO|nr:uncharacterized protein BABINDRAFT_159304 [Babjeviella inositovora NRRL Y-12698]ODQ82802.1 hypothetical protein BABINDRAFT_159304 [Babjeviella inositovora NRRL Y-12698]
MSAAGDDLEDGLEYLVDSDVDEGVALLGEPTSDNEEGFSIDKESKAKKRKRDEDGKLLNKKKMKMEYDVQQKQNLSKESTEQIADFVNNKLRRMNPDLSALELDELYFNKSCFRSTADWDQERNLEGVEKFILKHFSNMLPEGVAGKKAKLKSKKKPLPAAVVAQERKFITILSMSAIRACDVHRATKSIAGSSVKLINKNKIQEDLKILPTTRSRVFAATPTRLVKVLDAEDSPLKAEELKIIIVDSTYLDTKKQHVWDVKETLEVLKRLTNAGSKIYLY